MAYCITHQTTERKSGESCEECRKAFESDVHVCPHCWKPVSNSAYFGKRGKSIHLDGKCAEKQTSIPASYLARKSTAARSVDPTPGYWASSIAAIENQQAYASRRVWSKVTANVCLPKDEREKIESRATQGEAEPSPIVIPIQSEPVPVSDPLAERLAKLLEEQNELLRRLAA